MRSGGRGAPHPARMTPPAGRLVSPWDSGRRARGGTTSGHDGGAEPGPGAPDAGTEPDARFTLANERTFLAWNRTALALVVAGLGIVQLLPPFPGVPWAGISSASR